MDWCELEFFSSEKFKKIVRILDEESSLGIDIFPPREDILNAFAYTPLDKVKVVIFGQDPYHQTSPQYSHGLAFSVRDGIDKLPQSLVNIFRELRDDTGIDRKNGNLSDWAEQGVLLLNSSLTVTAGQAGSHSSIGWSRLSKDVIQCINEQKENVVFILWGGHARKYKGRIDISGHHVIESAHPSPLSANRGFFGSRPFSKTNKYLIEHGIEPIRW
jgi:uracil-DNA glycosylase